MPLSFSCSCGQPLKVGDDSAANYVKCPACGTLVEVPPRPAPLRPRRDERSRFSEPIDEDDYPGGPATTNGKATASLIFGLLSMLTGLLLGVVAIIFGILAKKEIGVSRGRQGGDGLATAGIVMGSLSFVLTGVVYLLLLPAISRVREAAGRAQSQNNLKQMALGVIKTADDHDGRIQGAILSPDGRPLLSWRVAMLPNLEQAPLYRQFHLNEPWDSDHNRQLISRMPKTFAYPGDQEAAAQGLTYYRAIVGPDTAFAPRTRYPAGISDGTSQTIMIVEAEDPVPWTKPDELVYDPNGPLPRFSKRRPRGFQAVLWDGSVQNVDSERISERTLRAACTARGNDVLGPDW